MTTSYKDAKLTTEQIDFLTLGVDWEDTQTGLHQPEHTRQVIRSLSKGSEFMIAYEQLTIVVPEVYIVRFNTIQEMYDFVVSQIG